MVNSLNLIRGGLATPFPGKVHRRGRTLIYSQPIIDLLFVCKYGAWPIECKATKGDIVYIKSVVSKKQRLRLAELNKLGKFIKPIVAVKFVRHRKVYFITDIEHTVKVTPDMPGSYLRSKGVWDVSEYFTRRDKK